MKIWYGMFREDVRNPDGQIERRLRKIRLGTVAELPTKNAARNLLSDILRSSSTSTDMSFEELVKRWERAEGSTMKATTLSLAMDTYDRATVEDFRQPLARVAGDLLPNLPKTSPQLKPTLKTKGFVGPLGFEPRTNRL